MKHIFLTVIFLLLFIGKNYSQCVDPANIYSFMYNGKKYEVVKEKKIWVDAATCAVERGGYLVEINDSLEQAAIYDAIINGAGVSPTYTSVANGGGIAYVWIGATDKQNEGTWLWDGKNDGIGINFWNGEGSNGQGNGTAVNEAYHNWGCKSNGFPMEPDNYNSNQNTAAIGLAGWPSFNPGLLGNAGEWNDIIESSSIYFVIEFEAATGIENNSIQNNRNVSVYPNPASDKISVKSGIPIVSTELYNILGQKIYSGTNAEINISQFQRGIYFIKVFDGQEYFVKKIILH